MDRPGRRNRMAKTSHNGHVGTRRWSPPRHPPCLATPQQTLRREEHAGMEHHRSTAVNTQRLGRLVAALGLVGAVAFVSLHGTAVGQAPAVPYPEQELYKPTP